MSNESWKSTVDVYVADWFIKCYTVIGWVYMLIKHSYAADLSAMAASLARLSSCVVHSTFDRTAIRIDSFWKVNYHIFKKHVNIRNVAVFNIKKYNFN